MDKKSTILCAAGNAENLHDAAFYIPEKGFYICQGTAICTDMNYPRKIAFRVDGKEKCSSIIYSCSLAISMTHYCAKPGQMLRLAIPQDTERWQVVASKIK